MQVAKPYTGHKSKIKMTKVSKSKVMKQAWSIFRAGVKNFSVALKEAWKQVRAVADALKKGIVTFWKIDGSVTTRRIAPLADVDYTPKGSGKSTDTIKVIDLDKLESGAAPERCIISFHAYQIIEQMDLEFHAQDVFANLDVPFDHSDIELEGNLVKVTTAVDGETVTVTVAITADDYPESVAEKLIEELKEWEEQIRAANDTYCDYFAEHGYN